MSPISLFNLNLEYDGFIIDDIAVLENDLFDIDINSFTIKIRETVDKFDEINLTIDLENDLTEKLNSNNHNLMCVINFPRTRYRKSVRIITDDTTKISLFKKEVSGVGTLNFYVTKGSGVDSTRLSKINVRPWRLILDNVMVESDFNFKWINFNSEKYSSKYGSYRNIVLDVVPNVEYPTIFLDEAVKGFKSFLSNDNLKGNKKLLKKLIYQIVFSYSMFGSFVHDLMINIDYDHNFDYEDMVELSDQINRRFAIYFDTSEVPNEREVEKINDTINSIIDNNLGKKGRVEAISSIIMNVQEAAGLRETLETLIEGVK